MVIQDIETRVLLAIYKVTVEQLRVFVISLVRRRWLIYETTYLV